MSPTPNEFSTVLRRLMLDHGFTSQNKLADAIPYDRGAFSRIVRGERMPNMDLVASIDAVLGSTGLLVSIAKRTELNDRTAAAAAASVQMADWVSTDQVSGATVDGLMFELARIAGDYVHAPLEPLFGDLQALRDDTWALLRQRPHPGQARTLLFMAGTAMVLLAHASQNLGATRAAMQQATAAERVAAEADHAGLRAWVAGTQALIAEWSRQPARAVDYAQRGLPFAPSGDQRVRLLALTARCAARAGLVDQARTAMRDAQAAIDASTTSDEVTVFGGILSFPATKATYYAGSTAALLGDWTQAEQFASAAIRAYESGPLEQRSYGDEALARIDLAMARLGRGDDLDGAAESLAPVLTLPAEHRIRQIGDGLTRVDRALTRFGTATTAVTLREQITAFHTLDHI